MKFIFRSHLKDINVKLFTLFFYICKVKLHSFKENIEKKMLYFLPSDMPIASGENKEVELIHERSALFSVKQRHY